MPVPILHRLLNGQPLDDAAAELSSFAHAMRHAVPVRRVLGVHTVFNLLGPLTNPADVRRQLLGVYASNGTTLVAATLRELGCEPALVVHGHDGQDEFSLTGETAVVDVRAGELSKRTVRPEDVVEEGAAVRLLGRLVEASHDLATPFHGLRAGGEA